MHTRTRIKTQISKFAFLEKTNLKLRICLNLFHEKIMDYYFLCFYRFEETMEVHFD